MIQSIVILKNGSKGYTASLRFDNESLNEDISHPTHQGIYSAVNYKLRDKGVIK